MSPAKAIECSFELFFIAIPSFFLLGLSGVRFIEIIVCGTLKGYKYLKIEKENSSLY